ncbi:MAG: hypothetical protein ABI255_08535 [Microbacteriaceae bacterium]
MSLSRKRQKELKRLRGNAEDLWRAQQDILDRANSVAKEAGRQVNYLTREEVAPRVKDTVDTYVRPGFDRGVSLTKNAARLVGERITNDVVPAVGTAIGTALSVGDVARDARVRAAVKRLKPSKVVKKESNSGIGRYFAVGAVLVAVAGVGYAVWQTFRADDELWVADEEPTTRTPAAANS